MSNDDQGDGHQDDVDRQHDDDRDDDDQGGGDEQDDDKDQEIDQGSATK